MLTSTPILLGGSFDPVHHGHLITARSAAEAVGASGVTLVPAAQSPFKTGVNAVKTPAEHRLGLLRAAVAGDSYFDILTSELERPSPSYTYDTAEFLFQKGWREIHWLIGADQLLGLPNWHKSAELISQVTFLIAARPGQELDFDKLPEPFRNLRHNVVRTPQVDISATDIRNRVKTGRSIRYLVPPGVEDYIRQHGLYR